MSVNPYEPSNAPLDSEGNQPIASTLIVSTSIAETFFIALLVVVGFMLFTSDTHDSPRIDEWYGQFPPDIAFVMFLATVCPPLAIPLTVMAFVPDLSFFRFTKKRFPVTLIRKGSPPLVGALFRMAWVSVVFLLLSYLGDLEIASQQGR